MTIREAYWHFFPLMVTALLNCNALWRPSLVLKPTNPNPEKQNISTIQHHAEISRSELRWNCYTDIPFDAPVFKWRMCVIWTTSPQWAKAVLISSSEIESSSSPCRITSETDRKREITKQEEPAGTGKTNKKASGPQKRWMYRHVFQCVVCSEFVESKGK